MTVTSARDAYATKALDDECQAVAMAPDGEQNETLNTAAFNLGQLVGAGVLNRSEVERRLLDAAAGYVQKDGEAQARATIRSGLNAGQNQPRDLSHLETEPERPPRPKPGWNGDRPAALAAAAILRAAPGTALPAGCLPAGPATLLPGAGRSDPGPGGFRGSLHVGDRRRCYWPVSQHSH